MLVILSTRDHQTQLGVCQNSSFIANCISRARPAEVMLPNAGELTLTTAAGWLKFARFQRLNASQRNCRLKRSSLPNRVFLATPKSVWAKPGPVIVFRPSDPKRREPVGKLTKALDVVLQAGLRLSMM